MNITTSVLPATGRSTDCYIFYIFWGEYSSYHLFSFTKEKKVISINRSKSLIIRVEIIQGIAAPPHDPVELLEIEHPVAVAVGLLQHFLEFFIGDLLADLRCNSLHIFEGNLVEVVLIEQLEDLVDLLLRISGPLSQ